VRLMSSYQQGRLRLLPCRAGGLAWAGRSQQVACVGAVALGFAGRWVAAARRALALADSNGNGAEVVAHRHRAGVLIAWALEIDAWIALPGAALSP